MFVLALYDFVYNKYQYWYFSITDLWFLVAHFCESLIKIDVSVYRIIFNSYQKVATGFLIIECAAVNYISSINLIFVELVKTQIFYSQIRIVI